MVSEFCESLFSGLISLAFFPAPFSAWKYALVFHDLFVRDGDEILWLFQQIPVLLRCEKQPIKTSSPNNSPCV